MSTKFCTNQTRTSHYGIPWDRHNELPDGLWNYESTIAITTTISCGRDGDQCDYYPPIITLTHASDDAPQSNITDLVANYFPDIYDAMIADQNVPFERMIDLYQQLPDEPA